MKRYWPVAVSVLLFGGLGIAGLLRPATVSAATAVELQAKLDALPLAVSSWVGADESYPARELTRAGAVAAVNRVYTRSDPPAKVGVLVIAGRPGDLGAHDPAVCFAGAGYKPLGESVRKSAGNESTVWTALYETAGTPPTAVQVCWGWSDGLKWSAAENARFDFADRGVIYKLYVTRSLPPGGVRPGAPDPTDEFLSDFLPATVAVAGSAPAARP
jgi:hypothetical protein